MAGLVDASWVLTERGVLKKSGERGTGAKEPNWRSGRRSSRCDLRAGQGVEDVGCEGQMAGVGRGGGWVARLLS